MRQTVALLFIRILFMYRKIMKTKLFYFGVSLFFDLQNFGYKLQIHIESVGVSYKLQEYTSPNGHCVRCLFYSMPEVMPENKFISLFSFYLLLYGWGFFFFIINFSLFPWQMSHSNCIVLPVWWNIFNNQMEIIGAFSVVLWQLITIHQNVWSQCFNILSDYCHCSDLPWLKSLKDITLLQEAVCLLILLRKENDTT